MPPPPSGVSSLRGSATYDSSFHRLLGDVAREYGHIRQLWTVAREENARLTSALESCGGVSSLSPDFWLADVSVETPSSQVPFALVADVALETPRNYTPRTPREVCITDVAFAAGSGKATPTVQLTKDDGSKEFDDMARFQLARLDSPLPSSTSRLSSQLTGTTTSNSRSSNKGRERGGGGSPHSGGTHVRVSHEYISRKSQDQEQKATAFKKAMAEGDESFDDERPLSRFRCRRSIIYLVDTGWFEAVSALIMASNIIMIGVAIDDQAEHLNSDPPYAVSILAYFFCIAFVSEALLRLIASGPWNYVFGRDWYWNTIDVVAASLSVFESLAAAFEISNLKNMNAMKVIRIVRLLRVFRIVRILRFISALKTLVASIVSTLKALFWAMVLIVLIIYGTALVFTQASSQAREDALSGNSSLLKQMHLGVTELEALEIYWGNVSTSMVTLFMAIANGVSWEIAYRSLNAINWIWGVLFHGYIMFTYFAVLNVVTANFCQVAIETAESDQELMMRSIKAKKEAYVELLKRLFNKIDANSSGEINLAELQSDFEDPDVQAFFTSLDLEPFDAWSLFKLLDTSGDYSVDVDEFVAGCMRLRGSAKQIDVYELAIEQSWLVQELSDFMNQVSMDLHNIRETVTGVEDPDCFTVECPEVGSAWARKSLVARKSMVASVDGRRSMRRSRYQPAEEPLEESAEEHELATEA